MSSWSEPMTRGAVLRGGEATTAVRPARLDSELSTSAFARTDGVDARLTDPLLQGVVDRARAAAVVAGHLEGHAAGYAAGFAAAAADAERTAARQERERAAQEEHRNEQVARALDVLTAAAQEFRRTEQVAVADVEDVVAELALSIAEAVLGRELATSTDPGRDAIARALALVPDGCPVTVRLHPADAAGLIGLDELARSRDVVLVADATVERGGCLAEAAGRQIDTQLGPALARVAAVLR